MQENLKSGAPLLLARPLTFFLRFFFRILAALHPLPSAPDFKTFSPKSVLIFSTAGIGDTLSDTPAIRAVKERYPAASLTVIVHYKRREILSANPSIDRLVPHRKGIFSFFSTLRQIRSSHPDLAIILRANDPDIWPMAYLSGVRAVVSRQGSTVFSFLVNCPIEVPDLEEMPGVLQTLEIAKGIGAETQDPKMVYRVTDVERKETERQILATLPRDFSPAFSADIRIAVQIHSSPRLTFRDWPSDSFVMLCRNVLQEFPVRLFFTGGPEDVQKAAEVAGGLERVGLKNRVVNTAGKLTLRQTAALLEQCALFITTDTGLMHLGFAIGVPTLALLHPYNAHRVGPYGYGALHHPLIMDGPERDDAGRLRSLSGISPETVLIRFRKVYSEIIP